MSAREQIRQNREQLLEQIADACQRTGRAPDAVTLVAVTKYAAWEWVETLVELGQRHLGESRPQQLTERAGLMKQPVSWHLIGHLQRNKVRPMLSTAALIHSVDSIKLLDRIESLAAELQLRPRVLLEVNISGEAAKDGFNPESLRREWPRVLACARVEVAGLMTMAPDTDDPETTRPVFRQLRELRDELARRSPDALPLPELSMGMSNDFVIAVEEGATLVRIGSSFFEGLDGDGYGG